MTEIKLLYRLSELCHVNHRRPVLENLNIPQLLRESCRLLKQFIPRIFVFYNQASRQLN